jgi:hypothetical protein
MASKFNEILVSAFIPAIKAVGKAELTTILEKIQDHNTIEVYTNALRSIHSSFLLLKEVAVKSKTKIDDGLIDMILESVEEAALEDGVVL